MLLKMDDKAAWINRNSIYSFKSILLILFYYLFFILLCCLKISRHLVGTLCHWSLFIRVCYCGSIFLAVWMFVQLSNCTNCCLAIYSLLVTAIIFYHFCESCCLSGCTVYCWMCVVVCFLHCLCTLDRMEWNFVQLYTPCMKEWQ